MTPVLLDTTVMSELVRPAPDDRVRAYVRGLDAPLLSSLTLHELAYGAARVADRSGRPTDPLDALIAASALVRGASVATRNVRDFEPLGVAVIDPWHA